MVRRNIGTVLIAAALIVILLIAFILALAQHKLHELALDLTVYLFATTLAVFVVGRILAWREERRWLAAKNWMYLILLETIDDLLKGLLPATVPREGAGIDEKTAVYEVTGERIHVGETVRYSPLRLLVRPGEKDLQSHISWYAGNLGPPRYTKSAKAAMSDAREQVRDMLATSGQLLEADITSMVMSFDQAIAAAIRHLDSAASMRDEKLEDSPFHDGEVSTTQRTREADQELAFVTSIIVESVVDSAIKPKAWLEETGISTLAYYGAYGIVAGSQNGAAVVDNSGSVSVTSDYYGVGYIGMGIQASGMDGATVTNSGDISVDAKYAYGIYASAGQGDVAVSNAAGGMIDVYSYFSIGFGVLALTTQGDIEVDNAGGLEVYAYGQAAGVFASTAAGDASVHNSGDIATTSGGGVAVGAFARASNHFGPVAPYNFLAAEAGFAMGPSRVNPFTGDSARGMRVASTSSRPAPSTSCATCPGSALQRVRAVAVRAVTI